MNGVVADSSFYLLFYNDIQDKENLHIILDKYDMHIGERIKKEIRRYIKSDPIFSTYINDISSDVDFVEILKDFYSLICREFPKLKSRINDGEWEAIGISYLLKQQGFLQYLILDEIYAYKFVLNNLKTLEADTIRTIRFLYYACMKDRLLECKNILYICQEIEKAIKDGKKPLYLTEDIWKKSVLPLITEIEEEDKNGKEVRSPSNL